MNAMRRVDSQMKKANAVDKELSLIPRNKLSKILPDTGQTGQEYQSSYERSTMNQMRRKKGMKELPKIDIRRAFKNWSN